MTGDHYPSYRRLFAAGKLDERIEAARRLLSPCTLCPRDCRVDRLNGEKGFCGGGASVRISTGGPHFGEERPLVGRHGSGTIFFTGCNLGCCFCQNYEISHLRRGNDITTGDLVKLMLALEEHGCHNVNLVTPTHFVPQILEALKLAIPKGLSIPLVYNCGGYESLEVLKLLEDVMDIYMPDFKFWSADDSRKFLDAPDYPDVCRAALKEMHRQVGDLSVENGLALRGLLVRHLVMPGRLDQVESILEFLVQELSENTVANVMTQYRPCHDAELHPEINRPLSQEELFGAIVIPDEAGIGRMYF
jgi:putative pyruvate formate lyase activating enzyme